MVRLQKIRHVLLYTLALNILVATAKIFYGYRIDSISMFSDGFHSLFDGMSNVIGLIGIWIAARPPDKNHPYGHRKFETLSTIAIAVLILFAGIEILKKAYHGLKEPHFIEVTPLSFLIMAITLLINSGVMVYERRKGRELESDFLLADSLHTGTDIFVSLSVIVSLLAAKAGYPVIDLAAAIAIAFLIMKMGINILRSATEVLTDAARIDTAKIRNIVMLTEGIRECHGIRTRGKVGAINVDLHVLIDPEVRMQEAHALAHTVEDNIRKEFSSIIDVVVHIEPYGHDHSDE